MGKLPVVSCQLPVRAFPLATGNSQLATNSAVVTQWQSASLPNWERGFDSHSLHLMDFHFGIWHSQFRHFPRRGSSEGRAVAS